MREEGKEEEEEEEEEEIPEQKIWSTTVKREFHIWKRLLPFKTPLKILRLPYLMQMFIKTHLLGEEIILTYIRLLYKKMRNDRVGSRLSHSCYALIDREFQY